MKKLLATLVAWGPGGLFLAALLDGAGVPIPGGVDVLMVYLGSQRPEAPALLAMIAVLGSTIGNFILFMLARRGGQMYLERHGASKRSLRFRSWFHHYGLLTVFISALVPLPVMPMKIFVLCAGALESSPVAFLLVFLSARIPRYMALAILGRQMGDHALVYLKQHVGTLAGSAAGLFVFLYLLVKAVDLYRARHAKVSA